MKKRMKLKKTNNKGFSLVELIIVVAIMAILVGILAPQYIKYVERARKSSDITNLDSLVTAIKVANSDGQYVIPAGNYAITMWSDHTTVKYKKSDAGSAKYDNISNAMKNALQEYSGIDFSDENKTNGQYSLKLKSSKWVNSNPEPTNSNASVQASLKKSIQAVVTIDENGSISVVYKPDEVLSEMTQN